MNRVLMTGSAVVAVDELLQARVPPTAINIFDLARLLESVILHDEVVVLSSTESDSAVLVDAISRLPQGVFRIEAASPETTLRQYAARLQVDTGAAEGGSESRAEMKRVQETDTALFSAPSGPEMQRYEQLLKRIDERYRPSASETVPTRGRAMRVMGAVPGVRVVPQVRDEVRKKLGQFDDLMRRLPGDSEARKIVLGFGQLYKSLDATGGSAFAQREAMQRWTHSRFVSGLILRARYYLMAAELLGIPYKPDSLRVPICWESLGGSLKDILVEERLVRLAEEFEAARLRSGGEVLGLRAFYLRIPLFLRRILTESRAPSDLVSVAAEIRASSDAKRFREYAAALTTQLRNEEIEEALAGLQEYSSRLSREYGKDGNEVVAALLSAPSMTLPVPTLDPVTTVGVNTLDLAVKSGRMSRDWWRGRRFGLISRTIKHAQKAKSLNGELQRIFGRCLDDQDLELLHDLDTVGSAKQPA